jgi:hypothetical protein
MRLVFASIPQRLHGVEQRKVLIKRANKTEILRYEQDREYEDCMGPVLRGDGCLRCEERCIASAVDASPAIAILRMCLFRRNVVEKIGKKADPPLSDHRCVR